jgi:nucleoside-diphosphate-sugar epimerase
MDKGTETYETEYLIPLDPIPCHKLFLKRAWWEGGFDWTIDWCRTFMPVYRIDEPKDEAGTGATREVPLGLQEHVLSAKLGEYIEYTLLAKHRFLFPSSHHRGRVEFHQAGPGNTRILWKINYTPYFYAFTYLWFFFNVVKGALPEVRKAALKQKKGNGKQASSPFKTLLKILGLLYLAFVISRAVKIPSMRPLHPSNDVVTALAKFREETKAVNEVIAKNTYLVIGGTGFTGSAIVDDLKKRGAKKVKIMGRSFPPVLEFPQGPTQHDRYPLPGVEYVRGDVTDRKALAEAMKGVDVIFHTAVAYGTPTFGSIQGGEVTHKINVDGMKNIYETARASKSVKQIIFTSSVDTVFTERTLANINETHPYIHYGDSKTQYAQGEFEVGDFYARTKILAEQYLLSQDNKEGIRTLALRPNGIYGPGEFVIFKRALDVPYILGVLPFYFDETQTADWTCVYNLVYAHILATYKLSTDPNTVGGKAYFITDMERRNAAAFELFRHSIDALGVPIKLWLKIPGWVISQAGHVQEVLAAFIYEKFGIQIPIFLSRKEALKVTVNYWMDNTRAIKDLGYKPAFTTDQCLRFTAEETTRRYFMN